MAQVIPVQKQCVYCGRMKDTKKDFYPNYNEFMAYNKMAYCKDCEKEIAQKIMDKNANFELGVRNLCSIFTMPFRYEAMNALKEEINKTTKERNLDYVFQYLKALKDTDTPEEYWQDLSGNSYLGLDILKRSAPTSDGDIDILNQCEKDWGKQDYIEDYIYLVSKFKQYTDGETLTPAMVDTVRYLCLAQLDVKKLRDTKAEQKDISTAETRVGKYLEQLHLNDFKFNKSKTLMEKNIEDWGYNFERVEPLDWEDENLKDRLGIDVDYDDIVRSNANKIVGSKDYPNIDEIDIKNKKVFNKKRGQK